MNSRKKEALANREKAMAEGRRYYLGEPSDYCCCIVSVMHIEDPDVETLWDPDLHDVQALQTEDEELAERLCDYLNTGEK